MRQWLAYGSRIPEKELARVLTEVIHGVLSGSMQERKAGK